MHQDTDSFRNLFSSERVSDKAEDRLEMKAGAKRSLSLLPQKEAVKIDLETFKQETKPLAKIWCVKMEDDTNQPDELNSQFRVMKTCLKARYRPSDLLRGAQEGHIENGAQDKGYLEEDSYCFYGQCYMQKEGRLYLNKHGIVACKKKRKGQSSVQK